MPTIFLSNPSPRHRLLPLTLVVLAHGALLALAMCTHPPRVAVTPPDTMEVSLLPPEPLPVHAVPEPQPQPLIQPRPTPALPAPPLPTPVSAEPVPGPVLPPPRVVADSAKPDPAPPAPLAPPLPAPAEQPATPPRADASRVGGNPVDYPAVSKRLGEQGTVILDLYVLADGSLGQVLLKQSSGYRRLDDAAMAAVKTWKFLPSRRGDTPMAAWYLQPVAFSLTNAH